jgi:hypothetical protein
MKRVFLAVVSLCHHFKSDAFTKSITFDANLLKLCLLQI